MLDNLDELFDVEPIEVQLTGEQDFLMNEYIEKFKHSIPMAYIPKNISKEELYSAIKKCLEIEEDKILDYLGIDIKDNRKY